MDDEDLEIIMEDGDDFALDEGKPVTTKSKTSSMKNLKIVLKDKVENKEITYDNANKAIGLKYYNEYVKPKVDKIDTSDKKIKSLKLNSFSKNL